MRETLRITPSAPQRIVEPVEDTVLGGKYAVKTGTVIIVNAFECQRDELVWGDDVRLFSSSNYMLTCSVFIG